MLASALGMFLLSPVFGIIAIAIKHDSPGPVFYHGRRAGQHGREFFIHKFRTMYERKESYVGPRITAEDDPRITRFGRWLRNTKLNELPQLWNVLKGEMSLVGPRPEDPGIVATWQDEVRHEILSVRPGITSPASVLFRNEEAMLGSSNVMSTYLDDILPSKLRLDQLYVRHRSFWLDMDVLLWTFLVLIPRLGSRQPPEERLFWGPISRLARRYISWFMIDALTALFAIGVTGLVWRSFGPLNVGWPVSAISAVGYAILFSIICAVMGVQRIEWPKAAARDALDLVFPSFVATAAALLVDHFLNLFPPAMMGIASALSFIGFVLTRYRSRLVTGLLARIVRRRGGIRAVGERVLILGGGEAGQFAAWMIENSRESHSFFAVGFVDDDLYMQGARIRGLAVLGKREDIPALVKKHDVGIIVFAIHKIGKDDRQRLLKICRQTLAHVVMLPDFMEKMRIAAALNGDGVGKEEGEAFSQAEITAIQVDAWLQELEIHAQFGRVDEVINKIQTLRERIRV